MSGPLDPVSRGQRLSLSAQAENAKRAVAKAYQAGDIATTAQLRGVGVSTPLLVKNTSGADLERFGVLGIGGAVLSPASATAAGAYGSKPTLEGLALSDPADVGRWVMALAPIADGKLGPALLSGIVAARIDVIDADDTHADIPASGSLLASNTFGRAVILHKESGTGEKWATLSVSPMPAEPMEFTARITSSTAEPGGVNRWSYGISQVQKTTAGYGGYAVRTGGRTGTAYNINEHAHDANNAGAVDLSSSFYTGTAMAPQPAPVGEIVRVRIVQNISAGTWEYEFAWGPAAHDGGCS